MSLNSEMTALANAVRSKSGKSGKLTISGMTSAVNSITTGGGSSQPSVEQATPVITVGDDGLVRATVTQAAGNVAGGTKSAVYNLTASDDADLIPTNIVSGKTIFGVPGTHTCSAGAPKLQAKTVTPTTSQQVVKPDSGNDGLSQVTVNAMPTAVQATPSISVNSSTGVITASATQTAGYVTAGTKSATSNLTTQGAATITPSTSNQTAVAAGRYTTGAVTVAGDVNLIASNIVSGKTIFNVRGSHTCSASTPNLQAKTATPSTSQQVVKPDNGYNGLSQVTVNAIPSSYVESASVEALLKAI